jgi:hypothetical protein
MVPPVLSREGVTALLALTHIRLLERMIGVFPTTQHRCGVTGLLIFPVCGYYRIAPEPDVYRTLCP